MKNSFILASFLFALVFAVHVPNAGAQCTIDFLDNTGTPYGTGVSIGIGQSFTACQNGFLSAIGVISTVSTSDVPHVLGIQAGTNILLQGNPQNVTLSYGVNIIELDAPLAVTAGETYSFGLFPTSITSFLLRDSANPYSQGTMIACIPTVVVQHPDSDLIFRVEILPYNPVSNHKSAWGTVKSLYR